MASVIKKKYMEALGLDDEIVSIKTKEKADELKAQGIDVHVYQSSDSEGYAYYRKEPEYTDEELEMIRKTKLLNHMKMIKNCAIFISVVVAASVLISIIYGVQIGNLVKGFFESLL